jgi:hypothetical protein
VSPNVRTDFGNLLEHISFELDPPPEIHRTLNGEYTRLGDFIKEDSKSRFRANAEIYPQGSKALGTLNRPVRGTDDFDLDAVYRRDIALGSVTQADLKTSTGDQLREYVRARRKEGVTKLELVDGRRCWTLQYDGFHIDVLPALPDRSEPAAMLAGEPILITDRRLHHWQASNPKGFVAWFRTEMKRRITARSDMMEKAAGDVDVKQIEDDRVKTPLQVAVQLLKRHRDIHFQESFGERPISIIITTLATHAYQGEIDPYRALDRIVRDAPSYIERRAGKVIVANPTNPDENFADKWNEKPALARVFLDWLRKVDADIAAARGQSGMHKVARSLGGVLGDDVSEGAARRWSKQVQHQSTTGQLRASAGSAALGTTGPIAVRKHTFYGEPSEE